MKASLCPHEMGTNQGLGEGDIWGSKDLRQQRPPDIPAASLCLSLHSCTSLLLRCLVPRGLLTRDLRKSLHGPSAPQNPAGGAKGAFICVHTQLWLLLLPRPGGRAAWRQVPDPLPPLGPRCQLGQDPLAIHSPQQAMLTLPEAKGAGRDAAQRSRREGRKPHLPNYP